MLISTRTSVPCDAKKNYLRYRSILDVMNALCIGLKTKKIPSNDNDTSRTKVGFHFIAGFPNVLGAIEGTIITIAAPNADKLLYACRKVYHSINAQAMRT